MTLQDAPAGRRTRHAGDHIVYFALRPDEAATAACARLQGVVETRGRPLPANRLHVSLNGLGTFSGPPPEGTIDRAMQAADALALPAFTVAFNRLAAFGRGAGERQLVLLGDEGVIGVERLRAALHAALAEVGLLSPRQRAFEPHLTLFRQAEPGLDVYLDDPVRWTVRELLLLDTLYGEGRQEILGCWPLG